ncbi:MAG: rhomboid family intramembrane serine protease [Microcystaceae cyanobacterium]
MSKKNPDRIGTKINSETQYNRNNFRRKTAYVTYGLIGVNLLMFALEINSGGSENIKNLYALGALDPQAVLSGQWWRLLNANFLHFGWVHLLMNMLGLYFLGRFVEFALGSVRYLIAYLISGIGSMLLFTLLAMKLGYTEQILVGASAAIMGLIGVISAILIRDWYQQKSLIAAQRLQTLLFIISIQFIFDWTTPQVSFLSHVLGLFIGLITSIFLLAF